MYSLLYVDDEEVLLGLNKIFLEKTGDFSVETALSGSEALEKMDKVSFDAIISDYDMPHMDGIALLKEVRSRHGGVPFLLFTGKGREEVVIEAVDNGVDFYIQKGRDMQGMIAELRYKTERAIEQRKMHHELDLSRRRMNDIINFLPDATFVRDTSGRVISWNQAMEKMTGIPRESMLGKGDLEYTMPFYHEKRPLLADYIFMTDRLDDSCYRFIEKSGDKMTSEVFIPHFNNGAGANLWCTAGPLYDSDGQVTGAIESFRDISDFCSVKRDLSISREMNRGFAEMIPVAVYEMDLAQTITFANSICYEWFGIAPDERDDPISIMDFIEPCDRGRAAADLREVVKGKKSTGQEYLLKRKDGSTFPALIYGGLITDPDTGRPSGVRGIIIDITERKQEALERYVNKERLMLALRAGRIGVWDIEMRTMEILDIHEWACAALGYQKEDLPLITINIAKSLVHPLDLPRILLAFVSHLSGKAPFFESEFRLKSKDGNWRQVAVRGKIIERDTRGEPLRITGVISAVTRRD